MFQIIVIEDGVQMGIENKSKIVIWGMGTIFERYREYIDKYNVVAIVDNNPARREVKYKNAIIISEDELCDIAFDKIFICSSTYGEAIYKDLIGMGIEKSKIHFYFDFDRSGIYATVYSSNCIEENGQKIVALVSHELGNNGAPQCLLAVAKYLKKRGYFVRVGSPEDGDLREEFVKMGIEVRIDPRLKVGTLHGIEWIDECVHVLVNTNRLYYLLRDNTGNAIWWLHEPIEFYNSIISNVLKGVLLNDIKIYSVSRVADEAIKKISPDRAIRRLMYGMEYYDVIKEASDDGKLVFVIVGAIGSEKGHDVLLKALETISETYKKNMRIVCVGNDKTPYANYFISKIKEVGIDVDVKGFMQHTDLMQVVKNSDCLICASRMESMSRAVTEAFMLEIPVIVSSKAGNTEFIANGENAYVFESENYSELANRIQLVMDNRKEAVEVGNRGREIFEKYFSEKIFEEALDEVFERME